MQGNKSYYVYLHRRKTDDVIFYVGKGNGNRHLQATGRNTYWRRTADKHGFYSQIFKDGMSEPCAFSLEKILIGIIRKSGVNLTNGTDGGEGLSGVPAWNKKKVHCSNGMTFDSAYDASLWANVCHSSICAVCRGDRNHCANLAWWYDGDPPKEVTIKKREVVCSNGMVFKNAERAAQWSGAPVSSIRRVLKGLHKTSGGYSWKYKD